MLFLLLSSALVSGQGLKKGEPFPEVNFPSVYDGKETSVTQLLQGKKTVLHLFASW